jgi:nicotinamidase-related amidase
MKPWDGIVPAEDIASFGRGFANSDRPLRAGKKPALVIVDMTRNFVDSGYPTGWSPTGYPAVETNRRLLDEARRMGIPIYFTKASIMEADVPAPEDRGRWRTANAPVVDLSLPPGDEVVDALAPWPGEIVIHKASAPSAFFGTRLISYLVYHNVDTVVVTGMTTSGCVRATVVDAFQNNFFVLVPHECSADRSQLSHAVSLFDMHMKYADVISLEETLAYLQSLEPAKVAAG